MRQPIALYLLVSCLLTAVVAPLDVKATTLTGYLTADEIASAHLSTSGVHLGEPFIQSDRDRETVETGTVELVEGQVYYLHVVGVGSRAWPAYVIGSFSLSDDAFVFSNGSQEIVTKADYWRLSLSGFPGENNSEIMEIPFRDSSWGNLNEIDPDAKVITSLGATGGHTFTIVISPNPDRRTHFSLTYEPNLDGEIDATVLESALPRQIATDENGNFNSATVDPGRLSMWVHETLNSINPPTKAEDFTSIKSEFTSFDFVLSSDSGLSVTNVSLNLELTGSVSGGAGRHNSVQQSSVSTTEIEITAQVADKTPFAGKATIVAQHEIGTGNPSFGVSKSATGALLGVLPEEHRTQFEYSYGSFAAQYRIDLDEIVTTPTYSLPVGLPFQVKLKLSATTTLATEGGTALSVVDLQSGLAFPLESLVFNLPLGVTVNSQSANIRDNRFEIPVGSSADSDYKDLVSGVFMRIPNIPGESQAYNHEDWIDLLGVSSNLMRMERSRQRATFEDVQVTKQVDKSSPKLIEALTQGLAFEEMMIEQTRQVAENGWSQFEFLLHDVAVTDYELHGENVEDSPLRESFSFSCDRINWIYRNYDARGFEQGRVEAYWDLLTDAGGSVSVSDGNNPPSIGQVENQSVDPASTNLINLNIDDLDTDPDDLIVTVSTSRPDLIGDLKIDGSGVERTLSYRTSALRSGFASITVNVSDGRDTRSTSIPILIDVEMTPYEGYLAAYFDGEDRDNLDLTSPIRDPDNDKIPTIIEFLLGTNPQEFNDPTEGVKTVIQDTTEGRVFTVDFKKRMDDPNIQAHLWGSFDLRTWQRLDSSDLIYEESNRQGENAIFEETTATVTIPSENEQPFYLRLQVEDVF